MEMNVDEDDTDILVRASLAIIPLHYLQTLPTPKLLTCTTCLWAFQPSSALSHVHEHKINLTRADKDMLKKIFKAHNFVKESKDVPCPKHHNPPIEGIMIHNRGLACDLCDYCVIEDLTMRNHFAASHKGTPGFSRVNSSPSAVQAFFLHHPKYFAVTPGLRKVNMKNAYAPYQSRDPHHKAIDPLHLSLFCLPDIQTWKLHGYNRNTLPQTKISLGKQN